MTESGTAYDETPDKETEATDPLGKVKGFVEEHPVAMVAGGILLGALVAGALSRAGSGVAGDKATRKGNLSRMSLPRRAADIAAVGLEIAAAYAAGVAGEKAGAASSGADADPAGTEPAKPSIMAKALRTLAPVITRHLPGKKSE